MLRKGPIIAERTGKSLDEIKAYRLKTPSLLDGTHKCSHCGTRLFEEEVGRTQWCCGLGKYNVMDFPILSDKIYSDKRFLKHPRRYNDLFSFCALSVPLGYHHPKGLSFMKILGRTYHLVYDLNCGGRNNSFLYIDDGNARIAEGQQKQLKPEIIREIQQFLGSRNPYVPFTRSYMRNLQKMPALNSKPPRDEHTDRF